MFRPRISPILGQTLNMDSTKFGHRSKLAVSRSCPINYVEHVRVTVKVAHPLRGQLDISIRSPLGTTSMLLDRRFKDRVGINIKIN